MNKPTDEPAFDKAVASEVLREVCRLVTEESLLSENDVRLILDRCRQQSIDVSLSSFIREAIALGKLTRFQAKLLQAQPAQALSLGPYLLIDKIGQGGMGSVYKGRHKTMGRFVAVKVLSRKGRLSPESVRRFQREVQAAAKLIHPNIVTAFDAGEQNGIHFLVMEYVVGQDLKSYVDEKGPLPISNAVNYILQAARGFQFAHENQIIHRDIKPANLLLDRDGAIKILDMGLARIVQEQSADALTIQELTADGAMMGTIDYLSPEQGLDTKNADARSDIYSLGCTLHTLLTGQTVYPAGTLVQKILAHRELPVPSLKRLRPDVPSMVDDLFQRMLAKDPSQRPQSMAEVIAALHSIGENQPAIEPFKAGNVVESSDDLFLDSLISGKPEIQNSSMVASAGQANTVVASGDETNLSSSSLSESLEKQLSVGVISASKVVPAGRKPYRTRKPTPFQISSIAVGGVALVGFTALFLTSSADNSLPSTSSGSTVGIAEKATVEDTEGNQEATASVAKKDDTLSGNQVSKPAGSSTTPNSSSSTVNGSLLSAPNVPVPSPATLLLKIYPANASVAILDKQGSSVIEFEMTADARKIDLPQGDYRIVVRNKGYESLDVDLHLESGKLLERDLLMTESPPSTIAHVDKSQDTRPAMESAGEVTSDKVASADSMLSKETNSPADMNAPILALNENAPKPDAVGGVKLDGWPMGKGVPKPMVVPCSPKEVREYQRQWARYYKKKEFITFNKFMNFAFIPPGEFEFGMDDKDIQELVKLSGGVVDAKDFEVSKPKHRVVIREPFYISVNEVNQAQVFALFGRTSYRSDALAPPDATKSILPAASNYAFAIEFCNKLCELNKLPPAYLVSGESIQSYGNKGFRLPTEEEWEFVARAGSEQRFWCKLEELHKYDIFRENSATLFTSVLPNPFGLFHVHGNFGEYVEGRAGDKFAYQPSKTGLTLMERSKENVTHAVIRGSTSSLSYLYYHVGRRTDGGAVPSSPWLGDDKGFRVIMDIDVVK